MGSRRPTSPLEITEAFDQELAILGHLDQLRMKGSKLSIDDFGTATHDAAIEGDPATE